MDAAKTENQHTIARKGLSKAKIVGCVILTVTGVFTLLGCLLAIYVANSGLGAPRDTGAPISYMAALVLGGVLSTLIPGIAWCIAIATSRR